MSYKDPILSQFQDKDGIDAETITTLIENARVQKDGGAEGISGELHERTVEKCRAALSIYTDLVKLKFLLAKSWELKTLAQSVMIRFGLQDIIVEAGGETALGWKRDEEFYKEIALKTISRCDKLSVALEQLSSDSREIMGFIQSATTASSVSVLLSDTMTLLLEMWFLCGHQLRSLKKQVASFFIKSKLLLIDHELELLANSNMDSMNVSNVETLKETIGSYKSFIKVLLQQLADAEKSGDQVQFEECLAIFMDVEGMYQAFNFTWLLRENTALLGRADARDAAKAREESDRQDLEDLAGITSFVNDSIIEEEDEDNDLGHAAHSGIELQGKDGYDEIQNKLPEARPRRLSTMSGTSDISLMMEKTSLTKELPHLLQAFNNAKKLANELENAREHGSMTPPVLSPVGSPSHSSSMSLDNSSMMSSSIISNNIGLMKSSSFGSSSKILENLAQRHQEFPYASSSPLTPSPLSKLETSQQLIRQDMMKLMSQTPDVMKTSPIQAKVPGFGSNILNNLYGIGSRQ